MLLCPYQNTPKQDLDMSYNRELVFIKIPSGLCHDLPLHFSFEQKANKSKRVLSKIHMLAGTWQSLCNTLQCSPQIDKSQRLTTMAILGC